MRAVILFNPGTAPYAALYVRAIETCAAPSVKVSLTTAPVHDDAEIEEAFAKHAREPGGGVIVMTDAFTSILSQTDHPTCGAVCASSATYPYRYYVADGGLMSYGIDQVEQIRGSAVYVYRILRG